MNLNLEDIYNNIESFRNKHNYTLDEMAKLIGMSNKSAYHKMIRTKSMKLEYLVNLLSNTDMTIEKLFGLSTNYVQTEEVSDSDHYLKRINELEEICNLQKKLIYEYEKQLGKQGRVNCG